MQLKVILLCKNKPRKEYTLKISCKYLHSLYFYESLKLDQFRHWRIVKKFFYRSPCFLNHKKVFIKNLYVLFLAATKQLYEWYFLSVRLSVRPSVCPSHLFDYVPIIVSSWNFQELSPRTRVTSMQKVKVRGQRSRSQRSQPNLTVSGL